MIRNIQNSFVSGEVSPAIYGRHDLKAYANGAAEIKNFVVRRTGGVVKRPGTDLMRLPDGVLADGGEVDTRGATRIIPFFYDNTTAYLLFLCGTWACVFECATGAFRMDGENLYKFDLGESGTFPSGTWKGVTDNALPYLRWKQAGDTIFITVPLQLPGRIVRDGNGDWSYLHEPESAEPSSTVTITSVSVGFDPLVNLDPKTTYGIWEEKNGRKSLRAQTTTTARTSPWTEGATVTLTITLPADSADSIFWVTKKAGGAWGIIGDVSYGNSTFVDVNYVSHENIYKQTSIRDDDDGGYSLIDFYQQRTVLAGNANAPFRLWFSRLSDLYNWWADRPLADDCPFGATLPAVRASAIKHIVSGKRLIILTEDGAYSVHSEGEGFTYRSCKIERATRVPCSDVVPFVSDSAVLYVAADGRRLIEMMYEWSMDGFQSADRSVLADHLTEVGAIQALAYQEFPDSTLWVLLDNGKLLSFTYMPEHEVYAWAKHDLKPPFQCTAFKVLDIVATGAITAAATGTTSTSQIYAFCSWKDPAAALHYGLLKMRPSHVAETDTNDALDFWETIDATQSPPPYPAAAGAVWRRSDQTTWTHVATAGNVTFTSTLEGSTFYVGFPVQARLATLRPEITGSDSQRNMQGMRRNIMDTAIRVRRCGALEISRPGQTAVDTMPKAAAGALFTGDFKTVPRGLWDGDGRLVVESNDTSPAEILSVTVALQVENVSQEGGRGNE